MVQGIQNQSAINAANGVNYDNGHAVYYVPQKYENDSFNGKTLLTIAGIAGAVIFRKNIGNFVKNHFPKIAEFFSTKISKPVGDFMAKHKDNFIIKGIKKAEELFLSAEKRVYDFFSKTKPAN